MYDTLDQLRAALRAAGVPEALGAALEAAARPAVRLEGTRSLDADIPVGASRIGGRPDLPASWGWPWRPAYPDAAARAGRYRDLAGRPDDYWSWATPEQCADFRRDYAVRAEIAAGPAPLSFVLQLDCGALAAAGHRGLDLPSSGHLWLFYDQMEQPWGFDPAERDGFVVAYADVPASELTRRPPPDHPVVGLAEFELAPQHLMARSCLTVATTPAGWARELEESPEAGEALERWATRVVEAPWFFSHRVGGWPSVIQNDMETECALVSAGHYCGDGAAYADPATEEVRATAPEWTLLCQLGSDDDEPGLMWGDSGCLYLWIRRRDLAARQFEHAHVILQCF